MACLHSMGYVQSVFRIPHAKEMQMSKQKPPQKPEVVEDTKSVSDNGPKSKEEGIELEGTVTEALRGNFWVEIPAKVAGCAPHKVLAHLAGKMRKNFIKIVPGDRVTVVVSPYDITRGRITFRAKG